MNNLHRRRMQENPYHPMMDYVRIVSEGTFKVSVGTKSGNVWIRDNNGGKTSYTKIECIKGTRLNLSNEEEINMSDANFYSVSAITPTTENIKIFDASKAKSLTRIYNNHEYFIGGKGIQLIDLTGQSQLTLLPLAGYSITNTNFHSVSAREIKINGCVNATKLTARGDSYEAKIYGMLDCKKCTIIQITLIQPCYDNGDVIKDLNLKDFNRLTELYIVNCPGITSLDNLPSGLTTLNCSGCTGISSLDNLPSGLSTLNCSNCTGVVSLDNLPPGLTSLTCGSINLSKADFSNTSIETISAYELKIQDGIFTPPITLKSFSVGNNKIKQGDFSQCVNLVTFSAMGNQWIVGKLLLPPSIQTLSLGTSWGTWVYPMPDLTACTNLTSINCQKCTNIPNLDQQAFIDSLPTFTDGSTHTINLNRTGVIADTIAALEAKGWTVQV